MDEGLKQQARAAASGQSSPSGGDGSEMEMFKEILIDSNSYLLATTAVVSVLHMVFEMLAFKNDVSRSGQNSAETTLTPANVTASFEAVISTAGQIRQTSATNLSTKNIFFQIAPAS